MKIFGLLFSQIALYPTITKFHLRKFINRFFLFANTGIQYSYFANNEVPDFVYGGT